MKTALITLILAFSLSAATEVSAQIAGGGGTATPGGSTTQVQTNQAGALTGDAGLTYDATTNIFAVTDGMPVFTRGITNTTLAEENAGGPYASAIFQANGATYSGMQFASLGNNASSYWNAFLKSRSTDGVAHGIVHNNDSLGQVLFSGDDGAYFDVAAAILANVDGDPGLDDMPGRLEFYTTADGAYTPTKRLTIDKTGAATFTGAVIAATTTSAYVSSGSAPAVANVGANSCGTTAAVIAGNDNAGIVTVGATAGTQCRITFTAAAPTRWQCSANNETTANLARATYVDTSNVDLIGIFVAGDVLSYQCTPR